LALVALVAAAGPRADEAAARPDVIFILVDDLRADALGCTGHPFVRTPHIDRLAREGVRFRNAFVTTPLCSPARASFLTGQYAHTHGVRNNTNASNARSHQLVTFPQLLQKGGYETAYVGKWHMGNDDTPRPGFNYWVSFKGQGEYVNPELNVDGKPVATEGYVTDLLTDRAIDFVKRPHEKPYCLYLAHKAVHGPFTPAERHRDAFSEEPIRRGPGAADDLEGKPALKRGGGARAAGAAGPADNAIRNQLRCLLAIDEGVGRIRRALEESGRLDSTAIVFTSDNGYFWGEHGLGDKRAAYEESIRIPLIARYPKLVRANSVQDALVLNLDIAPTLLELAGQPVPVSMAGRSVLPLLRGDRSDWRQSFGAEYYLEEQYPRIPTWQAVRTERWKYIRYPDVAGADELYDLKEDPFEMRNVIKQPGMGATARELRTELERLMK
jgi:N-acetylglucosamine-6-sulfatase